MNAKDPLNPPRLMIGADDVRAMMERYEYSEDTRAIITQENLLPLGMLNRLQTSYGAYSSLLEKKPFLFSGRENFTGLKGFRAVLDVLRANGIEIDHIEERELFVEVYRFLATRHTLNAIDWDNYAQDSIFHLCFAQPGMINAETVQQYLAAKTAAERTAIAEAYMEHTNPHDGKQQLNKPWFENQDGGIEFLDGSQHKYPQTQLIFDTTTQNCFSYCTYCFRHAQVRSDEDMFLQKDIAQIHAYLRQHKEVTDLLITGGDGGYMPASRMAQYVLPIIEDPELMHIKNIRLGTRLLTYQPEMILSSKYNEMLELFDTLRNNGIQFAWMAHFCSPRELLNPSTIAAILRLQNHGVKIRSQSPIMNHISLFSDENGKVDVERSAQNWIDLANLLSMLGVGFHSMYCARPTGEHHYFAAPLADVEKVFGRIYHSLSSINRPSRHISMTISAGKLAILGTTIVNGEKCFALQFTEGRNMAWMDRVILAKYDEHQKKIDLLKPYDSDKFFFEDELKEIEAALEAALEKRQA